MNGRIEQVLRKGHAFLAGKFQVAGAGAGAIAREGALT